MATIAGWFDRYRGHVITGMVRAVAVAALARSCAPTADISGHVDIRPVALRTSPEIDAIDTPGGSSTVINIDDEDGHAAVIWVSAADEPEAI